jgi:hypothetical protein
MEQLGSSQRRLIRTEQSREEHSMGTLRRMLQAGLDRLTGRHQRKVDEQRQLQRQQAQRDKAALKATKAGRVKADLKEHESFTRADVRLGRCTNDTWQRGRTRSKCSQRSQGRGVRLPSGRWIGSRKPPSENHIPFGLKLLQLQGADLDKLSSMMIGEA